MVCAQAFPVFPGGDHGIFGGASFSGVGHGNGVLRAVLFHDPVHHRANDRVGGSGVRVAVSGVHHFPGQRDPAVLYGDRGAVPVEDVSGDEAQTGIYFKGRQPGGSGGCIEKERPGG